MRRVNSTTRRTGIGPVGFLRWILPLPIGLVLMLTVSCGDEIEGFDLGEHEDLRTLSGRFISSQPINVAPGRFWEADEETRTWSFRGWADLIVQIDETQGNDPLQIRLIPDQATSPMHFTARWNDRSLGVEAVRAGNELVIRVPPIDLVSGVHRLRLLRAEAADELELRKLKECRFTKVEVSSGPTEVLDPDDRERLELTRAFFEDGVTGTSAKRRGGLLVSGRRLGLMTMTTQEAGEISFRVSSFLASETRFLIEVDGVEHTVRAGAEAVEFRVAVDQGVHELKLLADGPEHGFYLWGEPAFVSSGRDHRGPVILVTLDTTRKDALSIYGGLEVVSPNIARLAQTATVFDQAWSTSPWTLPSHATLFTGLYPTRHGAGVSKTRLDGSHTTLAEIAREAGFRTAGFAAGALSASHWGLARGFDSYHDPDGFETVGDTQTELVGEWIGHHAADPFFLFVNYFDPHALYQAPAEFEELLGVEDLRLRLADVPVWNRVSRGDPALWRAVINGEVEPTADAIEYLEAAYLSEVAFMDHQIGRLVSILEDADLFDRSTLILVADHGEFLGEEGFFSHGCRLDPELTEIPLLIKWPSQKTAERDPRLVSQVDLFATILDALGATAFPRDGLPLRNSDRSVFERRTTVFMEEHENRIHPLFANMTIARHIYGLQEREQRQLVWTGGSLCYDRSAGGWSAVECEIGWQRRLEELAAVAALPVDEDLTAGDVGLTDEMREHLEALGYIR